jgi:nucleosome assembly protein 1-like 1
VFQHCAILKDEIGENDLPILAHLTQIKHLKEKDSKNYSLVFEFSENEYFENTELKKRLIFDKDENNADYSESTEIEWKDGKDVTVKKIQKK